MPRIARVTVPRVPHHITQRGNCRQNELRKLFKEQSSEDNIYYMPREDYESDEEYEEAINEELELHEYYQEK